jgi:hypothetical protein
MIAICTPSRGLIFSKTVECIFNGIAELNKHGLATQTYFSHELPIPSSHNNVTEKALQDNANVIIFIEEDMYVFPEGFLALANAQGDIATMQYNDKNGSPHGIIHYNEAGEVIWGGLGATSFKRHVFETLGSPYFRTDTLYKNVKNKVRIIDGKEYRVTEYEAQTKHQEYNKELMKFVDLDEGYKYGGLDIDIYTRARKAGFKIELLKDHKAHHFDLIALGEKHTNNGLHEIRQV